MYKNLTIVCLLGAFAVILGAFGAHALKENLTPEAFHSFETAIRYQIYHVLFLLFVNVSDIVDTSIKNRITNLVVIGILFFSGSIYGIHLLKVPAKFIWFITPIGGIFLILGWIMTAFYFSKKLSKSNRE